MRRECGGHRLQAPRQLLQDLHSAHYNTYAIESGRDFGSPPFSLDFAQSKMAGILVRFALFPTAPRTRILRVPPVAAFSWRLPFPQPFLPPTPAAISPTSPTRPRGRGHGRHIQWVQSVWRYVLTAECVCGMQAVADEEGYISLINTTKPKSDDGKHSYSWLCHRNAIFDIAWSGMCLPLLFSPIPPPLLISFLCRSPSLEEDSVPVVRSLSCGRGYTHVRGG